MLARLQPNQHLLLPSRLDLRGNAQYITCLLKSGLLKSGLLKSGQTCGVAPWSKWGTRGGEKYKPALFRS